LSYLPEADIRRACQVSHFWKVVAEELVQFDDDEDELSDVGDYGGAEDSGSGDEAPESGPAKTKAIVIDNGSCWIRAGFAGDRRPRVIIAQTSAAVIDPSESKGEAVSLDSMHHFLDTKATWKAMEKCWKQVFEKLGVDPSEYKILITQPVFSPNYVKANYLQILFKRFKAQAVYVTDSPVLTAYSYGKYTGMVVDIGLSSVQVCAIIEGYMKENVTRRASYLGGEASTQRMYEFLKYTPLSKINFYEALKIANKIKEQYCFVATDFVAAQKDPKNKVNYKLPNGEEITIQRALPSIGEIYFDPKKALGDRDEQILSLQEMIQATAEASDLDTRKDLLENILISGGESLMPGFVERLEREIKALMPHAASYLKLHADKDRNNAVFNGGAILAGLDMFQKNWIMPWDWAADQPAPAPPRTPASSSAPSGPPPPVPSSASRAKSPARASSPRRNM
jgi:actin-related protein